MTLRLRLVLAILALVTVGLAVFGVVSYSLYSRSEYQRLDDQLRNAVGPVNGLIYRNSGLEFGPGGPGAFPSTGGANTQPGFTPRAPSTPLEAYGELIDPNGKVIGSPLQPSTENSAPALPDPLPKPEANAVPFTVGSVSGSTQWRALIIRTDRPEGSSLVVAIPMTETTASLQRLVLIGAVGAVMLLAILGAGSWLILRRGLRPLEQMATSARSISAGDLSERVAPSDDTTEIGQLGMALNSMLAEIEEAFHEREATEHRLRQFLADASHELRTPLTSIQGFAELFRLGADEDLDHVNLEIIGRRIEEESARMKVLVEDLLLLARLDETRPFDRVPVDLAVLAADACSDAVAADPDRTVTLNAPDPLVILGDQDHLRQAITNLVTNALGHTPAGTPIEVGAVLVNGEAIVTVRDHGGGLALDSIDEVFNRFWQADDARVGSGAGLGLAIVTGIATEHGGSATAENAADGGALFTLRFPLNADA